MKSLALESGELGIIDDKYINSITKGALNVMRELDMKEGQPDLPENPLFIAIGRVFIVSITEFGMQTRWPTPVIMSRKEQSLA